MISQDTEEHKIYLLSKKSREAFIFLRKTSQKVIA